MSFLSSFFGVSGKVEHPIMSAPLVGGIVPRYVKRPLVGEGNSPQYYPAGFQLVPITAPAGAGKIPLRQFQICSPQSFQNRTISLNSGTGGGRINDTVRLTPLSEYKLKGRGE